MVNRVTAKGLPYLLAKPKRRVSLWPGKYLLTEPPWLHPMPALSGVPLSTLSVVPFHSLALINLNAERVFNVQTH